MKNSFESTANGTKSTSRKFSKIVSHGWSQNSTTKIFTAHFKAVSKEVKPDYCGTNAGIAVIQESDKILSNAWDKAIKALDAKFTDSAIKEYKEKFGIE